MEADVLPAPHDANQAETTRTAQPARTLFFFCGARANIKKQQAITYGAPRIGRWLRGTAGIKLAVTGAVTVSCTVVVAPSARVAGDGAAVQVTTILEGLADASSAECHSFPPLSVTLAFTGECTRGRFMVSSCGRTTN